MGSAVSFGMKVDDAAWKRLRERVSEVKGMGVKVGVLSQSSARIDGPATNVEVAIYNEFGTETIPERPFLRGSFALHREEYRERLGRIFRNILDRGADPHKELSLLGQKAAANVKRYITQDGTFAPNAPSTLNAKLGLTPRKHKIGPVRAPKPLEDTGQLVDSISYEVVGAGGEK